jgi:hypothetical protein
MNEYFDYESCEQIFDTITQFYDCILKKPIGHYTVGARVSSITIDFEKLIAEFYESECAEQPTVVFDFTLNFKAQKC